MAKSTTNKTEPTTARKPATPRKAAAKKPAPTTTLERAVTQEQIAHRAHELSAAAGHPDGRDVEFWLEAERQLRAELER